MEFEVQESKILEDGKHNGVITKIEYRTEPYSYTDIFIQTESIIIKAGYPSTVSERSALGQLLTRFGAVLKVKEKVNPEDFLIDKDVQFVTTEEVTKKGTFARVIASSLKPVEDTSSSTKEAAADKSAAEY